MRIPAGLTKERQSPPRAHREESVMQKVSEAELILVDALFKGVSLSLSLSRFDLEQDAVEKPLQRDF